MTIGPAVNLSGLTDGLYLRAEGSGTVVVMGSGNYFNNNTNGIAVGAASPMSLAISGLTANNNGSDGVLLGGNGAVMVSGLAASNNGHDGLESALGSSVTVGLDCAFNNNGTRPGAPVPLGSGIDFAATSTGTLTVSTGTTATGNTLDGVLLLGTGGTSLHPYAITGLTATGNGAFGISANYGQTGMMYLTLRSSVLYPNADGALDYSYGSNMMVPSPLDLGNAEACGMNTFGGAPIVSKVGVRLCGEMSSSQEFEGDTFSSPLVNATNIACGTFPTAYADIATNLSALAGMVIPCAAAH
jgi:hypothetical protein